MKQAVNSEHGAKRFKPDHCPGAFPRATGGLWIAGLIGGCWLGHLCWLLSPAGIAASSAMTSLTGLGMALGAILLQTFLNTGLFVTIHDAIHGLVYPGHLKINRVLGSCFASAYAGLSYGQLAQNHWLHHRAPMTPSDPDSHPLECDSFWPWFLKFLGKYWGISQFLKLAFFLFALISLGHVSLFNLAVFWAIPLGLSSLQLFYFGTYQPHRASESHPGSRGCTKSQPKPWLISLLACYHFSYHQEHHDHLEVPWWALPRLYKSLQAQNKTSGQKSQPSRPWLAPST